MKIEVFQLEARRLLIRAGAAYLDGGLVLRATFRYRASQFPLVINSFPLDLRAEEITDTSWQEQMSAP